LKKKFDYIISFLYTKIIPEDILKNARFAAINFHPGPPEYPGTGCYNLALYNNDKIFGTTCHHMLKKADSGKIISVKRFPLFESDTVGTLKERTMIYTILIFFELIYLIIEGKDLPRSKEEWKREPYTRKDLNKLLQIGLEMPKEEIDRRIRATACNNYPGPYIEIHGKKYSLRAD
jgi:methionyl-tRNA formyltransferase